MVTGVMPRGWTGPFTAARAGPVTLAQASGAHPPGAKAASSLIASSGTKMSAAVPSARGKGGGSGAGASQLRFGDREVEVPSEEKDPARPDPVQETSALSTPASSAGTSSRKTCGGSTLAVVAEQPLVNRPVPATLGLLPPPLADST